MNVLSYLFGKQGKIVGDDIAAALVGKNAGGGGGGASTFGELLDAGTLGTVYGRDNRIPGDVYMPMADLQAMSQPVFIFAVCAGFITAYKYSSDTLTLIKEIVAPSGTNGVGLVIDGSNLYLTRWSPSSQYADQHSTYWAGIIIPMTFAVAEDAATSIISKLTVVDKAHYFASSQGHAKIDTLSPKYVLSCGKATHAAWSIYEDGALTNKLTTTPDNPTLLYYYSVEHAQTFSINGTEPAYTYGSDIMCLADGA